MPSGFVTGLPGEILLPTSTTRSPWAVSARLDQDRVHAGQLARVRSREQVVERQHRVGLAAAEVGLELHHRVAALAREALHAAHEQGFRLSVR